MLYFYFNGTYGLHWSIQLWFVYRYNQSISIHFNLKRMKKIARWHCSTKISKTNLKTPLLICSQGCQWCQKTWKTKLKTTLVSWSAKIQPKLNKIWKTFRKQGFFDNFCSFLTVFNSFFNFGWILELQLIRVDFSLVVRIFWHPWHPWGCVNSGVKRTLVTVWLLSAAFWKKYNSS